MMSISGVCGSALLFLALWVVCIATDQGAPVVFIPGNGASQLLARRRDGHRASHCPPGHTDWYQLWMDVWTFLPGTSDTKLRCWADVMSLEYDKETRRVRNKSGIEVIAPGFGSTKTVETLDDSWLTWGFGGIAYAKPFIEYLVSEGYERNVSVRAAPYDFRLAPHEQNSYFTKLRLLVEETFHRNQRRQVALVGHSLGGVLTHYFLRRMTTSWKERYVHALVTISTPYAGTSIVHLLYATGYGFGIPGLDTHILRDAQRTQQTNALLFASPKAWSVDDVIVQTPRINYTAYNIEQFLRDVNYEIANDMRKDFQSPEYTLSHPNVPFWCIYSNNIDTFETFIFKNEEIDKNFAPHQTLYGQGDGMVNYRSLRACRQLGNTQKPVHVVDVDEVEHTLMLSDETVHKTILSLLQQPREVMTRVDWETYYPSTSLPLWYLVYFSCLLLLLALLAKSGAWRFMLRRVFQ